MEKEAVGPAAPPEEDRLDEPDPVLLSLNPEEAEADEVGIGSAVAGTLSGSREG